MAAMLSLLVLFAAISQCKAQYYGDGDGDSPSPTPPPHGCSGEGMEEPHAAWVQIAATSGSAMSVSYETGVTYVTNVPLQPPYIGNGIKMVLGPPKRYGIKMVKKWYGQFQRGLPKDGRYGLEMVKKWSEITFLQFPDHVYHLWGDSSGIAHTISPPFLYHALWGVPKPFSYRFCAIPNAP